MTQKRVGNLGKFAKKVHENAVEHGWWDNPPEDGTMIALMHSELSEALEGLRKDNKSDKIEGFTAVEEELADVIIRILDYSEGKKLRLVEALIAKHEFNIKREFMHGGKKF